MLCTLGPVTSSAPELPGLGPGSPHPTSMMSPAQTFHIVVLAGPRLTLPVTGGQPLSCPRFSLLPGAARCRLLTPLFLEFWSPMFSSALRPLSHGLSEPMASCPCPACHGARCFLLMAALRPLRILVRAWLPILPVSLDLACPHRRAERGLATLAGPDEAFPLMPPALRIPWVPCFLQFPNMSWVCPLAYVPAQLEKADPGPGQR